MWVGLSTLSPPNITLPPRSAVSDSSLKVGVKYVVLKFTRANQRMSISLSYFI